MVRQQINYHISSDGRPNFGDSVGFRVQSEVLSSEFRGSITEAFPNSESLNSELPSSELFLDSELFPVRKSELFRNSHAFPKSFRILFNSEYQIPKFDQFGRALALTAPFPQQLHRIRRYTVVMYDPSAHDLFPNSLLTICFQHVCRVDEV